MRETAWLCKPYPEQHRGGMRTPARRISRGGGIEPARQREAKIDGRSRQNSAYRTGHTERAGLGLFCPWPAFRIILQEAYILMYARNTEHLAEESKVLES